MAVTKFSLTLKQALEQIISSYHTRHVTSGGVRTDQNVSTN